MLLADKLKPKDTIGIISPCIVAREKDLEAPVSALRSMGFSVRFSQNLFKDTYGYAASPEERADDFNRMIQDPDVKMILFSGGEVCNEILPYVDFEAVKKNPKILCSYSDSTTILNAVYAATGLVTYYGPAPRTFSQITDYNRKQFQDRLMTGTARRFEKSGTWNILNGGQCEGILIGGYLVNFALLVDGAFLPYDPAERYLLFLEDHIRFNEPAAVSRYLSHIEQSKFFSQVSGLIFGHYSEEDYPELTDTVKRLAVRHGIPAIKCDDFGHGENNAVLPIGLRAALDADHASLLFEGNTVG